MRLTREPTVPHGVLLLVIAVGMLLFGGRDYADARSAYQAAASMPVADYVVDGRGQVVVGSGKSRHTEYFLELVLFAPQPAAPPATTLRVAPKVHERSRKGDQWRARIAAGGPLFDPVMSGVERNNGMWRRVMALVFGVGGVAVLLAALRRR